MTKPLRRRSNGRAHSSTAPFGCASAPSESSTLNTISFNSSTPPVKADVTVPFATCEQAYIAAASADDSRCVMVTLNPRRSCSMAMWLPGALATDSAKSCGGASAAPFSTYSCM